MNNDEKLEAAYGLIESCIMDFEKLKPFMGDAALAVADLYRENLRNLKEKHDPSRN